MAPHGTWQDGGNYDSTTGNRWDYGMTNVSAGGNTFAVIIGGNSTGGLMDTVHVAQVSGGAPGTWSETNTYPPGGQRHITSVGVDDLMISMGGTTAGNTLSATSDVYLGRIDASGTITWQTASEAMNQPRGLGGAAFHPYEFPPVLGASIWELYE